MDDDFSSYKEEDEVTNQRIESATQISKNPKINYHYNEAEEDKIFIELKESYESHDEYQFIEALINGINFNKSYEIYNKSFFVECDIPNILYQTLSDVHSIFEEPEKVAYYILKYIETIIQMPKCKLKDFFMTVDFFTLFINIFTECSLFLQLLLVPIVYSIANTHTDYIPILFQQHVDLAFLQNLILSPDKCVKPNDRFNALCLSALIIFSSIEQLECDNVLLFISNIIGKLEYQSNQIILNIMYFLTKKESYAKEICSSNTFYDFIIDSFNSKNKEIKKTAIKTLTNFFNFKECDHSFDFNEIEELTKEKSEISSLAFDLLIAISSNPNCTDSLVENGIFHFLKLSFKINDLYDPKRKSAIILTNTIKNIDSSNYMRLAEEYKIIPLILSFLSIDDDEIDEQTVSTLYYVMTSQGFIPENHRKLLHLFEEAGGNEILENKEINNEKAEEMLEELHKYLYPENTK